MHKLILEWFQVKFNWLLNIPHNLNQFTNFLNYRLDGTKCGENMVCYNNSCVGIEQFIEPGDCPTDNVVLTCSGHGVSIYIVLKK